MPVGRRQGLVAGAAPRQGSCPPGRSGRDQAGVDAAMGSRRGIAPGDDLLMARPRLRGETYRRSADRIDRRILGERANTTRAREAARTTIGTCPPTMSQSWELDQRAPRSESG